VPWFFDAVERHDKLHFKTLKNSRMSSEILMQKLERIENLIEQQGLLKKDVINFIEACHYLGLSKSHMYKLTSSKSIPHFCPQGKRLYFKRTELDDWLLRNRTDTQDEIDQQAANYLIKKGRVKL
jgi:excisionase family DNA binding protein|tara:strand:+ start:391 stop:765 length:375 start_codon:yes stop_codon:yes gene_type:complete